MCAGMAVLLGPPSVGGSCYLVWLSGNARHWRSLGREPAQSTFTANFASFSSIFGAYFAQRHLLVRHFDEGGALSLDWKKGTDSLGEPLKIRTWSQFYKAAGPPVFARVGALIAAFYVAGHAHAWVTARQHPAPPKPQSQPPHAKARKK